MRTWRTESGIKVKCGWKSSFVFYHIIVVPELVPLWYLTSSHQRGTWWKHDSRTLCSWNWPATCVFWKDGEENKLWPGYQNNLSKFTHLKMWKTKRCNPSITATLPLISYFIYHLCYVFFLLFSPLNSLSYLLFSGSLTLWTSGLSHIGRHNIPC